MRIGVKYCGGCNSVYNRGRQVQLLKERFPEHTFEAGAAAEGKEYDIWLVVCGCLRACASTEGLRAVKRIFVLPTERSFSEARGYLERVREGQEETGDISGIPVQEKKAEGTDASGSDGPVVVRRRLRIGQEAWFKKTFFKDDVDKFAALTGDYGRQHTDVPFAEQGVYGRPVVHGVLAASLISTVMGTQLPGEGTVFVEETVRFLKPVFYGDTLTATVRLTACRESGDRYLGTLSGLCKNQRGETVVWSSCRQMMMKRLFEIENPGETWPELEP